MLPSHKSPCLLPSEHPFSFFLSLPCVCSYTWPPYRLWTHSQPSVFSDVTVFVCLGWEENGIVFRPLRRTDMGWAWRRDLNRETLPFGCGSLYYVLYDLKFSTWVFSIPLGAWTLKQALAGKYPGCVESSGYRDCGHCPAVLSLAMKDACHMLGQPRCLLWGLTVLVGDSELGI